MIALRSLRATDLVTSSSLHSFGQLATWLFMSAAALILIRPNLSRRVVQAPLSALTPRVKVKISTFQERFAQPLAGAQSLCCWIKDAHSAQFMPIEMISPLLQLLEQQRLNASLMCIA